MSKSVVLRREFLSGMVALALGPQEPTAAAKLVAAARSQIGVTKGYDPRYTVLAYPNGDVPRSTGVCCDVIVRAYRDALALDLQKLVHEDMSSNFAAYPNPWRMKRADANIDHRRVPNLETFLKRQKAQLWFAEKPTAGDAFPGELAAGDVLTWRLHAQWPHIGIVSEVGEGVFGKRVRVVHNWGNGAEELPLADFAEQRAMGHYRWALA